MVSNKRLKTHVSLKEKVIGIILGSITVMWLAPYGTFDPTQFGFYRSIIMAVIVILLTAFLVDKLLLKKNREQSEGGGGNSTTA